MRSTRQRMLIVLGAALCACADEAAFTSDEDGDLADTAELAVPPREQGIYQPDAMDNHAHPAITVLEWIDGSGYGCSGTLVASNVVLTAAHCFNSDVNSKTFEINVMIGHNASSQLRSDLLDVPGIESYTPYFGNSGSVPTVTGNAANVIVHPQYVFGGDYATWDVALVVLDIPVPENLVTPLSVLDAGLLPSPPLSPDFEGLEKWNGIYVQILGGGHTSSSCQSGAWSPIALLDSLMFEPGFADGGSYFRMQGSMQNPGPAACHGDSGGPIVTAPNDPFGTNLPNFEVISVVSKADASQNGPVLNGVLRSWLVAHALDADGDGLEPDVDNCDDVHNPQQEDNDGDGWGDACDTDDDNDGVPDVEDNCPDDPNPDQTDWDGDGKGWECDPDEHDLDGDYVPNADDNCPWHHNPYQENCNIVAEQLQFAGSDGTELGDACDPVPCATTQTAKREFITQGFAPAGDGQTVICLEEFGRSIENIFDVRPMRGSDFNPVATNDLEIWFCPCEEANVEDCTEPPWNCTLSPSTAGEPSSPWLSPSLTEWNDLQLPIGQPLSTTFQPWVHYPQPIEFYGWDYLTDYQDWVVNQQIWTPTPSSSGVYGSGTDMRGLLMVEDPIGFGLEAHGVDLCLGDGCSMASTFVADIAPDRATSRLTCKKIPIYKPAPWWTYCPECLDIFRLPYEELANPPVLTIAGETAILYPGVETAIERELPQGYGLNVSEAFAGELLGILASPEFVVVSPSEPIDAALERGQARAFVLSADATRVVGQIELGAEGFGLRSWEMDAPMSARTGFAAAYSLQDATLYVAGGTAGREPMGELWQLGADGEWSVLELTPELAPIAAEASLVTADGMLWVVDVRDRQRVLLQIDLATGDIRQLELAPLDGAEQAWLVQMATGELMLVTTNAESYEVAHLSMDGDVVGSVAGEGQVVAPPVVQHGALSVGLLRVGDDIEWIQPTLVPMAELSR